MTEEQVKQIIREELSNFLKSDKFVFERLVQFLDGRNIQLGRTNGTIIGTDTDQRLGFYGKTPVVQAGAIASPSGGGTTDIEARNAIDSIRTALKNLGLTA